MVGEDTDSGHRRATSVLGGPPRPLLPLTILDQEREGEEKKRREGKPSERLPEGLRLAAMAVRQCNCGLQC